MRTALLLLAGTLALAACRSTAPLPSAASTPTGMVAADVENAGRVQDQRPALSAEVLPSIVNTATLKAETPLLQRPTAGSVILKTLPAGETVQLLGALGNADGPWRSVSVGEIQGWVLAAQLTSP